jgi:hypothetical protein
MADDIDDEVWAAIGDPTPRRVLDLLRSGGPSPANGLATGFRSPVRRSRNTSRCAAGRPGEPGAGGQRGALRAVRPRVPPSDGGLRRIRAVAQANQQATDRQGKESTMAELSDRDYQKTIRVHADADALFDALTDVARSPPGGPR